MKHSTRSFFALAMVASAFIFTSCGDKEDDTIPTKSVSEKLMAKSWTLTAETEATGTGAADNTYNDYDSYEKDNVYKFNANSVFMVEEGATKGSPSDPASVTGIWNLSDSDKSITYQAGLFGTLLLSSTQKGEIQELTDTKLVVKMTDASSPPTIVTVQTFTAK